MSSARRDLHVGMLAVLGATLLTASATAAAEVSVHDLALIDRLSWGVNVSSVAQFRKLGIEPVTSVPDDALAAVLPLETESGMQYWFGFKNFYVITRYNRSTNYAMAVYEIARGIRARVKG